MAGSELLIGAVFLGLAAGAFAAALRVASPKAWQQRKPIGCNLCWGWWNTFFMFVLLHAARTAEGLTWLSPLGNANALLQLCAATAVAGWVLSAIAPPALHFDLPQEPADGDQPE